MKTAPPILTAAVLSVLLTHSAPTADATKRARRPLDPRGKIHIPIGICNTVDTLKTFVEAEGCFSPGVASYGVYFWLYDPETKRLTAPTMDGVECRHGLTEEGYLIPWSAWSAGPIAVKSEVCEVRRDSPQGGVFVVGARVQLTNRAATPRNVSLFAALRPLGPAGWPIRELAVSPAGDALLVEGHPAIVANEKPSAAGVSPSDSIGRLAMEGKMPGEQSAQSDRGECSGAMRLDLTIAAGQTTALGFVCPVLPGRRAVGHRWDGVSKWAQFDLARPNPPEGGVLQPDPGLEYYLAIKVVDLFREADDYWKRLVGQARIVVPDRRWSQAMAAIAGHAAMSMNEGAPDVAVVNYNVFNRDGVYVANILQKTGRADLAGQCIDYFLSHPFNGRVDPEADNPGQILWIMGEHWRFTGDRAWLARVYPKAAKLAAMIRYYRTTPGPHYVSSTGLDFGDALPHQKRQLLRPGSCDGHHPEYTEAFDIAGLRAAAMLAEAVGNATDREAWRKLADELAAAYDKTFGQRLPRDYGSYCVLWPCRLYPSGDGAAHEQFKGVGTQRPAGWRYFPLAAAHQGLLAGNRAAGYGTVGVHLDHEQMGGGGKGDRHLLCEAPGTNRRLVWPFRQKVPVTFSAQGWYAFDEGGKSGAGGWGHVLTTWDSSVAMPHGWAIAELWLLVRDCLLFEDGDRLVLFGGVPPEWFSHPDGIVVHDLPTHFGRCSFRYRAEQREAVLQLTGDADPPGGLVLRLPPEWNVSVSAADRPVARQPNGDFVLPRGTRKATTEVR